MKKIVLVLLVSVVMAQGADKSGHHEQTVSKQATLNDLDPVIKHTSIIGAIELMRRKATAKIWFDSLNSHKRAARIRAVRRTAFWSTQYMHRINKNNLYAFTQAWLGNESKVTFKDVPVLTTNDVVEIGYDLATNYMIQPYELATFKWDTEVTNESPLTVIAKSYTKKKVFDLLYYCAHTHNIPQSLSANEWVQNAHTTLAFHAPIAAHVLSDAVVETIWNVTDTVLRPMGNYLITSTVQNK